MGGGGGIQNGKTQKLKKRVTRQSEPHSRVSGRLEMGRHPHAGSVLSDSLLDKLVWLSQRLLPLRLPEENWLAESRLTQATPALTMVPWSPPPPPPQRGGLRVDSPLAGPDSETGLEEPRVCSSSGTCMRKAPGPRPARPGLNFGKMSAVRSPALRPAQQ